MPALIKLQIGKKGLTNEFQENLKKAFVKAESIRIGVLKSGTRDREEMKKWAEQIVSNLGKNFSYKIIGYTLAVRKWRMGKEARDK